jgi:anhydro-N-acetylmuramic acid kinase
VALYIGLMSGTSADGVDGVLADWPDKGRPRVVAHVHRAFDAPLRSELLALNRAGPDELHRSAQAAHALAVAYAAVVRRLLDESGHEPGQLRAIGAHGQTVRHQPRPPSGAGYTLQLLNGALLAELCNIDVVCDLRSRDIAAGGQGAPLVPALHQALFAQDDADVAVLNVGGIANLSLLPARTAGAARQLLGFDCGPGNALMDAWCEQHTGQRFDADGRWAATGQVDPALLQALMAEPFLAADPPKSTGRDLFDGPWLAARLATLERAIDERDVQATLAEFTALAASRALQRHASATRILRVCGGGARNAHLMRRLQHLLQGLTVTDTQVCGVPVDQVEALAFAWLARAFVMREAGNVPSVTGARGPRVLGALYPAA